MKHRQILTFLGLLLMLATPVLHAVDSTGDRNVPLNIVYPPKALVEHGGPVYDITKPPFNAKGDGITDDTRAFVAMMNAVRDGLEARRQHKASGGPAWFYVPNGTYLVSDSIVPDKNVQEGFCGLRLIGQDRRKTIIRLKDGSRGFEAGAHKPLLTWSKDWEHHQCGIAWGNELRNITLDTGKGNPGAVGVLFMGANACSMDNLTIISGDGQGHAGLWFPTWAVQGYFNDITVQGFDYGIELLNPAEVNPTLEWITLKGQRKAGIHVAQSAPCLRKVLSENIVPALHIDGPAAHVVLLDSVLTRGAANLPAIVVENPSAQVFVRDVITGGYGAAVVAAESLVSRGQRLDFPAGTLAKASFATNGDGGPEMLIDGNPDTSLAGAPNSCPAPREPVWVDIVFPAPITNLAGIELGGAEKFNNYYAKEIEVWVDSDGNSTFDTPVARIDGLGGGGKQACVLDFGGKLPSVKAIRLLVVEQNRTGSNRAFFMNGVGLLTDAKGTTLKPTPSDNVEKRIDILRTGKPPVLATVGNPNSARRTVPGGTVSEWMNGTSVRLSGTTQRSMRLPIEEVPPATWESDPTQWATPEDFTGDDQTRVQAAFNAGKPNVMLTGASYSYKDAVRIPAGVRHVELMNATPRGPALVVAEASDQPLWIHHPGNRLVIEVRAPRPLFVRYGDAAPDFITDQPMTAHLMALANTGPRAHFCPANVSVFARSINNENKGVPQFPVDGGRLWVLGFKTEGPCEAFAVSNGGILEVLGGYRNNSMSDAGKPMILNNDSQVSFVGFCSMANIFREAIWETRGGTMRKLSKDDLPARSAYTGNYFVPLYLGYELDAVSAKKKMKSDTIIPIVAESLARAKDYRVSIDESAVPVLDTQVGAVASFSMTGSVEVLIELERAPKTVVVRPLSRNIATRIEGSRIVLRLEEPGNFSVECDDDIRRPLFLFASPVRTDQPKRGDPGVIYLEAGKVHRFDELRLESNQTLYFEPGAVLEAPIRATDVENIRILGSGIIDSRYRTERPMGALKFIRCKGVFIQDVHILDSWGWTLHPLGCANVVIDSIRETCWRPNCDGIDIETCQGVRISDSFLYSTDDCIAVKVNNLEVLGDRIVAVDGVLVERTVFWNCIGGNAMEIGFELSGSTVQRVVFRDCDIIRVERGACLSIHAGDTATIRDILFENIRVEDARDELIDFYVGLSIYSKDCPDVYHRRHGFNVPLVLQDAESGDNAGQWVVLPEPEYSRHAENRGRIERVTVRNIQVVGPRVPPSIMKGYDAHHGIKDIRIEGLTVGGRPILSAAEGGFLLRRSFDVTFQPAPAPATPPLRAVPLGGTP